MERKTEYFRKGISVSIAVSLLFLSGCQTLKKKFTRKPKGEEENVEEVIYAPQDYPAKVVSTQELYRNYYALVRGWAQELDDALVEGGNHKRQVMCITEMVNNLNKMRDLLTVEAQPGMDKYIALVASLRDAIAAGKASSADFYWMKVKLDSVKARIARDYLPSKMKGRLIP
ncbi:MAG: hypothetical protein ACOY3D_00540 [Candidatus Omnitrophota bacterium]